MRKVTVYFFDNDTFYDKEVTEMPDTIPRFSHREWLVKKFDHQYRGMTLVAYGDGMQPVMVSGARR